MPLDDARRDLERRLAVDPEDAAAHVALLALDEREGKTWEPLSAVEGIAEELQVRAANDEDPLALAILQRDWDARNVIVEAEHEGQEVLAAFPREAPQEPVVDILVGLYESDSEAMARRRANPRVGTIPPVGTIMSVPHKAPLWDRETFGNGAGSPERDYFRNMQADAQGRPKQRGDTSGGFPHALPRGYEFFLYHVQAFVDAGSDADQAERLWNEGRITLVRSMSYANEWPMRTVMLPPRGIPTSQIAKARMFYALPGANVTIQGQPLRLVGFEDWFFRVECPGLEKLPLMIVLLGIRNRAPGV